MVFLPTEIVIVGAVGSDFLPRLWFYTYQHAVVRFTWKINQSTAEDDKTLWMKVAGLDRIVKMY